MGWHCSAAIKTANNDTSAGALALVGTRWFSKHVFFVLTKLELSAPTRGNFAAHSVLRTLCVIPI